MAKLYDRAWMNSATTGTGTVTLSTARTGYFTFAEAGVQNGDVVSYCIEDGDDFEYGIGTYTSAGTTLSRDTVTGSKISGVAGTSKISLSGNQTVAIVARKADILSITETQTANRIFSGPTSGGAAAPTFRALVEADVRGLVPVFTVQKFLSGSGTYTTPANCRLLRVRMLAGGAGGSGLNVGTGTGSTGGGNSSFGSWTAIGATGNSASTVTSTDGGGTGGTDSTGTLIIRHTGGRGQSGFGIAGSVINATGAHGGSSLFGGAGVGTTTSNGTNAKANSGAGGGGAGFGNSLVAPGGSAGEFAEFIIPSPTSSYAYSVGAGGSGGSGGQGSGGTGGSGFIIVEEYY